MDKMKLTGPFSQLLTMRNLPLKGALKDEQLEIIPNGGIVTKGDEIVAVGDFEDLLKSYATQGIIVEEIEGKMVGLPAFVDAHTHICFGGSRAMDYAARNAGKTYLEIAKEGGGIWSTVRHTRAASQAELVKLMRPRVARLLKNGVGTVEIKSGYGLSVEEELKMLRAIKEISETTDIEVVATCLAAHIIPKDFEGGEAAYLQWMLDELVPIVKKEQLCTRFDIFVEDSAYSVEKSKAYLTQLQKEGFEITIHGDQFTAGGSQLAVEVGAVSVDHLEASGAPEIALLAQSEVIPVALPGASLGIGCAFTPARKLLDAGCSLAIASDWNPGSAPMGDLLTQAAILGAFEKLSTTEVLAAMTFRAAAALSLTDRGRIAVGQKAKIIGFPTDDYRDILYQQGQLKPNWSTRILPVNIK